METWCPDLSDESGPKYLAIANAMERDVAEGRLVPGHRLPAQRELARKLGVDLTTITRAYEEARRKGLLDADGRRGSFVRASAVPVEESEAGLPPVDTGMNMPPITGALLPEAWARTTVDLLRARGQRLQYQPAGGAVQDRDAAARLLARRGSRPAPISCCSRPAASMHSTRP